ncbi:MAG: tRNA (adenosine(37)-N6)-threonylcarbamoyltransferase complex ATPase subunit type 1 TsaE [Planctomycetia bacterium]|nr:tRNA (adenosine(37)-N6)-threonylcarbamoyltransferase complex ATPase subunit type 1 TsaE [Planctomycetia bacterium]
MDSVKQRLEAIFAQPEITPTTLEFSLDSLGDTDALGEILEKTLPDGAVVALEGTLGTGKTRLVQAVARAAGIPDDTVTSPTFVLIQEYRQGRRPIYHFDVYRLRDEDEFLELGPDEYFDGEGLTFVEWADRVENCLPKHRVEIHLEQTGATSRNVVVRIQ